MRALVQRVTRASVMVEGSVVGEIGLGFVVLLGVGQHDTEAVAKKLAAKVAALRVFEDEAGKMNLGLEDVSGAVLCVSQFTLYGDLRRGRRPSFEAAAPAEGALDLYDAFCKAIEGEGVRCERGRFGAHMALDLRNDGPVTIWLDSDDLERPRHA